MEQRDYVSSKLGAIKWLTLNNQSTDPDSTKFWVTGTYDHAENLIAVWTMAKDDIDSADREQLSIFSTLKSLKVGPAVRKFVNVEKNFFAASFDDNGFGLFRFSLEKGILLSNFVDITGKIGDHDSTGLIVKNYDEVISCGHDG